MANRVINWIAGKKLLHPHPLISIRQIDGKMYWGRYESRKNISAVCWRAKPLEMCKPVILSRTFERITLIGNAVLFAYTDGKAIEIPIIPDYGTSYEHKASYFKFSYYHISDNNWFRNRLKKNWAIFA